MLKSDDDRQNGLALRIAAVLFPLLYLITIIWVSARKGGSEADNASQRRLINGLRNESDTAVPVWIQDYVRFHNAPDSNSTQYLVWACTAAQLCGGIGDRARGIVGSFYLALATRRKLLLYNPDPVALAEIMRPADLDWTRPAPLTDLDLDSMEIFHNDLRRMATDDAMRALRTIRVRTNTDLLWLTVMNDPAFVSTLEALQVPHGNWSEASGAEMLFAWAWSVLMRPSDALLHDLGSLRNQTGLGSEAFNLVHIRTGSHWADGGRHGSEDDLRRFASCLDTVTALIGDGHPIYVASDDVDTKKRFATMRSRVVYDAASEPFHVDRTGKDDPGAVQRNLRAWSEFYLVGLALCPVISWSGYSMWPVVMSRDLGSGRRCFARFDHCEPERVARSSLSLVSVRGLDP